LCLILMILSIWKKSEYDRNCLIKIDNSVWGTMSEKALRTHFHYGLGSVEITLSEGQFLQDELLRAAWNRLLDWLSRQEHSTNECKEYFKKYQYHPSIISHCLSEAVKKQYVDDERYCRLLIESMQNRHKSPVQIKTKLIEKRLPENLWEPILKELYDPVINSSIIMLQAEKAYQRYASLDKNACYEKCLTALYRKGFDLEEARGALSILFGKKT
jgi:SOS response regulatory protein OraA/RecX